MFANIAREELRACLTKVRIGTRLAACGLAILSIQGILWIEQGYWTPCDMQSVVQWLGLRLPSVSWQGGQAIIDWLLAFPLSALPIVAGVSIAWSGAASADSARKNSGPESNWS